MIDGILAKRNASTKACITVKTLISLVVIAMAVALPQILHVATGAAGGVKWLPMYLPVIIGACVLGAKWGVAAAILSPITGFLLTSAFSSPMPAAARLPFMAAELAVMALIAGGFSSLIAKNAAWSIAATAASLVIGRAFFILLVVIFQSVTPFSPAVIMGQIITGIPGLIANLVIVPIVVSLFSLALKGERSRD